tara:strand:- start:2090 stop:2926 length:837 start_codon:yes stop_codon:yes gene_type:complete
MAEITAALVSKLRQQTGAGMMDCKKALVENDGDLEASVDWLRMKGAATAEKKSGRATQEGVIAQHIVADAKAGVLVEINCETDFVAKNEQFQQFAAEVAQALVENAEADLEPKRLEAVGEIGENIRITRHERLSVEGSGAVAAYIHHGSKVGVLVEVSAGQDTTTEEENFKQLVRDITLQIAAASPTAVRREELDADLIAKEREIAAEQFKDKPPQAVEKIVEGKLEKYYQTVCLVDQAFVKNGELSMQKHIDAVAAELGDTVKVNRFLRFQVGETAE